MTYACPLIKIIKESGETIILRRLDPMRVPIILTIILKLNVFYVFRQVGEVKKLELEIQTNRRQLDTFDRLAASAHVHHTTRLLLRTRLLRMCINTTRLSAQVVSQCPHGEL